MMRGDVFGGLFDFDLNGKTDAFELALGFNMIQEDEERCERARRERARRFHDDEDGEDELVMAGLDPVELELMDDAERREALEDAGLDPDDYL